MRDDGPIRIVHVLFHFGIGGLENGVVNLINRLDEARYRHVVVCLSDFDPDYARRVRTANCTLRALHKRPGQDPAVWLRMWRLLREIRPDVLHTRNFAALEMQVLGCAAGVPLRVHGEHGWDVQDLAGGVAKYRRLRRVLSPTVHRFIALSQDIERYLTVGVGIPPRKVVQIYNGVDEAHFRPTSIRPPGPIVIGTVGRMKAVKNQTLLCRAFVCLAARRPELVPQMRLRLIGSGPLQAECLAIIEAAGLAARVDFTGDSAAVAEELQRMDVFVLPSLAEGISNTILEAMASGLPVIATEVGGNPELVADSATGVLVEAQDEAALSNAIERYVDDAELRQRHGAAGRVLVERRFSLDRMVQDYDAIYRGVDGYRRPDPSLRV